MQNLTIRKLDVTNNKEVERLYEICLLTGDNGQDATALYQDPRLIGTVFAAQYAQYSPEFCLVVVDEDQTIQGYAIGTPNSNAFEDLLDEHWWPAAQAKYRTFHPDASKRDGELIADIMSHPIKRPEVFDLHPAHFHIDLLPAAQGQGFGRKLLTQLFEAFSQAGATSVHLGVGSANTSAISFYEALGFTQVSAEPWGYFMAKDLQNSEDVA